MKKNEKDSFKNFRFILFQQKNHQLPFQDELSVVKKSKAFKRHSSTYRIEIIDSKDALVQLEASKSKASFNA